MKLFIAHILASDLNGKIGYTVGYYAAYSKGEAFEYTHKKAKRKYPNMLVEINVSEIPLKTLRMIVDANKGE